METNFAGKSLRVMLVDDDAIRSSSVEEALIASGFEVVSIIATTSALLYQMEQHRPDVVLIDLQFPGRDILESLAVVNDQNPTPMIMFSQQSDPAYIGQAFKAGVSTYITEGVRAEKVKPIIDVALAQFESFQSLRNELNSARTELQDSKVLAHAKSLLIQQKKISESEAHALLHRLSMENNLKLVEVATTIVATLSKASQKSNP